ncbi:hypothetical protein TIFTF001_029160 [Ficus carica]|uniref:Uncharacterized protein n=1 Tax=Ficus carica TaxID=3494 RepID=A0AA88J311_FICCA|nr:hypothetical protein TIFTF001_029160 [Ficus carica]
MGESRTPKIVKKITKNCKENHHKSQGKSNYGRLFSSPSKQDLRPPRTGFSEHVVFSGDGHLCGGFGGYCHGVGEDGVAMEVLDGDTYRDSADGCDPDDANGTRLGSPRIASSQTLSLEGNVAGEERLQSSETRHSRRRIS